MDLNTLTTEQRNAYDAVMSGTNTFITGGAGVGKSYLLKFIVEGLIQSGKQTIVCSFTNSAAILVDGSTIHRVFDFPTTPCITEKHPKIMKKANKVLKSSDVIIIDEISMVRIEMFDAIVASIERVGTLRSEGKPQLVVMGDFCQLPPVIDNSKNERQVIESFYGVPVGNGYAFTAPGWERCHFKNIILTETKRQDDSDFITALNKARLGDISCLTYFNSKSAIKPITDSVSLYSYNDDVDKYNLQKLATVFSEEVIVEPIYRSNGIPEADAELPTPLRLKVGAKVIITKNESDYSHSEHIMGANLDKHWMRNNRFQKYHNGSVGTILAIDINENNHSKDAIVVSIESGDTIIFYREEYEMYQYEVDNTEKQITKRVGGSYFQFPLKLGYASSIHKSQGQTYDSANIDPNCWSEGQLYVALSRIRDIKKLYLTAFIEPHHLKVNPLVKQFYEWLEHPTEKYPFTIIKENEDTQSKKKDKPVKPKDDKPKDRGGRPNRFPSGTKQMRIPNELTDTITMAIDRLYPKSSSKQPDTEQINNFINHINQFFN